MGRAVKVALVGASHLQTVLANLGERTRSKARDLINDTALHILADAVAAAPSDTGRLRQSLKITFKGAGGLGAEVGSNLPYSAFVEFGTGVRGSSSTHPPLPPNYSYGMKPGMHAQPYLFPAVEGNRLPFKAKLKEIIKL